jgi:hypothetical protein
MLQPDQLAALQDVLAGGAAQAAHLLGERLHDIETFLSTSHRLISENLDRLNDRVLVVALDTQHAGNTNLSSTRLLQEIRSGRNYIHVDRAVRFVDAASASARMLDVLQRTKHSGSIEVIYQGSYVYVVVCGELVDERDLRGATAPPVANPWKRSIAELDALLADHMRECIDNERRVRYWSDKAKRILLSGPDGTERIFHHDLFWWLDRFVIDRLAVIGEARGLGQDATDITVVTVAGNFVIEVKWLGTNDNGTKYQQERINEGLRQVREYLQNDPKLVRGFVVLYDGRPAQQHASESDFDPASRHHDCESPRLLFLRSETPSVVAKTPKARAARRKK